MLEWCTMRDRGMEIKVGLLIVTALGLLAIFLVLLGTVTFSSGFRLYVDFDFSGNLQPGAPVKVSGIKVGKVEEVRFLGGQIDPQTKRRVQVRMVAWVEDRAKEAVREDASFFVNT